MAKTACYEQHQLAKARMVDFHGWRLPLHYGSQLAEHRAVRESAGIFDVSHMGLLDVSGHDAERFLRYVLASDVARLQVGTALYTCLMNHDGGMIDDIIVYKRSSLPEDPTSPRYRLVINAARAEVDLAWLQQHADSLAVQLTLQQQMALLAVQGPTVRTLLQKLPAMAGDWLTQMRPFQCVEKEDWLIACTGYTGEDGFEVMLPSSAAPEFWQHCVQVGMAPCGLGARDSLRLEAGFNLYGQDMNEQTSPHEVGLAWVVHPQDQGRQFIGRDSFLASQNKVDNRMAQVGLLSLTPGVLRSGSEVHFADGAQGHITSASYSPLLQRSIALAQVPLSKLQLSGQANGVVAIPTRGREVRAGLLSPPFVRKGKIAKQVEQWLAYAAEA